MEALLKAQLGEPLSIAEQENCKTMKTFKNYHSNYTRNSFAVAMAALLWGCATPSADPQQASTPPVPPPPVQPPFDEAFSKAANDLFSHTQLPATSDEKSTKYALVIDPLVDGVWRAISRHTHHGSTSHQTIKINIHSMRWSHFHHNGRQISNRSGRYVYWSQ